MAGRNIIELKDIIKRFYIGQPNELEILHGIDLSVKEGEFVNYIACDTMEYRKMYSSKAVKKTLTIPEWLNEEAVSIGVNFSQVLQEALLAKVKSR